MDRSLITGTQTINDNIIQMTIKFPNDIALNSEKEFMRNFAGLYEHSSWVAETAYNKVKSSAEFNNLEKFHSLLCEILLDADPDAQQKLILAHPMLSGKKKVNDEITEFSINEQKSAGLDNCTDEEITTFDNLNQKYLTKFNFPFIMAIKEKTKTDIVTGFEARQQNTVAQEKLNAINEINKIAWLRIKDIYGI